MQWSRDGQAIPNANSSTLEVTGSGRYTVSYTSPNGGCTVVAMPVEITVDELPIVPIFENTNNLLQLIDETNLTDNLEIEWYLEGELLAGETNTNLCAETSGNYTLRLRDPNSGCESEFSELIMVDPTIINCNVSNTNQLTINSLRLYPNPVQDQLFVSFEATADRQFQVRLVNSIGQIITQTIWQGGGIYGLDMNALSSGWYVLQVTEGKKVQSFKVVKQ